MKGTYEDKHRERCSQIGSLLWKCIMLWKVIHIAMSLYMHLVSCRIRAFSKRSCVPTQERKVLGVDKMNTSCTFPSKDKGTAVKAHTYNHTGSPRSDEFIEQSFDKDETPAGSVSDRLTAHCSKGESKHYSIEVQATGGLLASVTQTRLDSLRGFLATWCFHGPASFFIQSAFII